MPHIQLPYMDCVPSREMQHGGPYVFPWSKEAWTAIEFAEQFHTRGPWASHRFAAKRTHVPTRLFGLALSLARQTGMVPSTAY